MSGGGPDLSSTDVSDADRELARRVGLAWREIRRGAAMTVLRDLFFGVGDDALEPGQMDTLDILVQADSWRMGDLAEALRVDPSTATRAIERLTRAGLAERTPCTDDKRVVKVSATPAGRDRYIAVSVIRNETLDRILARYAPDERPILADYLERFVAALDDMVDDIGRRT
jgi:DNA-binding MarR family transcriptional regulator